MSAEYNVRRAADYSGISTNRVRIYALIFCGLCAAGRGDDGETDPQGRFWAGTMGWDAEPGAGARAGSRTRSCAGWRRGSAK